MSSYMSRFHNGSMFAPYQDLTFNHYTNMPQHEYISHQGDSPFSWARNVVSTHERQTQQAVRKAVEDAEKRHQEELRELMARMRILEERLESTNSLPPQRWGEPEQCSRCARGEPREDSSMTMLLIILIVAVAGLIIAVVNCTRTVPHVAHLPNAWQTPPLKFYRAIE